MSKHFDIREQIALPKLFQPNHITKKYWKRIEQI